jgi:hypothetical protein
MAKLLPEDLRDRCKSLSDIGECYLASYDGSKGGDIHWVRYVPGPPLTWESLQDSEFQRVYFSPNGFESSSAVGRSNKEYVLEKYGDLPGVVQTNFLGLAIRVADLTEEMMEEFAALQNYPVLDDDRHSEMERESQRESWANWVAEEFTTKLEAKFDADIDSCDVEDDELFRFFCDRLNSVGGEWIEESDGGWYIYGIENVVASITREDCDRLGILLEVAPWED